MRKGGYPLVPIVVGFVLGPIFETNFRRTGLIAQGDVLGYLGGRPIAIGMLAVVAIAFLAPTGKALLASGDTAQGDLRD